MRNNLYIGVLSVVVFLSLLLFGFRLASQKQLWNDEIYSQLASVENISYSDIMIGKVGEGNTTPLFYIGQKLICATARYHSPAQWSAGTKGWDFDRPVDRIILRIGPVVAITMAIMLIFFFCARYYSIPTAIFSVFLSLYAEMLLRYWAEARPYALWVLLTTLQVLVFLLLTKGLYRKTVLLKYLVALHILLALTVILSLPQIALICTLTWIFGVRDWRQYIFLFILPAILCLFYYSVSPKYPFDLIFTVDQYLRANISRDRFYIVWLFTLMLLGYGIQQKFRMRALVSQDILKGLPAFAVFCGAIAAACSILLLFKIKASPVMQFPVTEKYFIFLAPVGVIALAILVDTMVRALRPFWAKAMMVIFVLGMTIPRAIKVFKEFSEQYPGFFS